MDKTQSSVNTLNLIKQHASSQYQDAVPDATAENAHIIRDILFGDNYQPQLNEFVTSLFNRIYLTVVRNKTFNNPLSILKKGASPLGTDIQDIYTNPAEKEKYELTNDAMAQLLKINDPDTKSAYYRRNRQDKYTKTIAREVLQGAFTSWDKFNDFTASIINSLYSGNYIDEWQMTKDLVDGAYDNNKVIIEITDDVVDGATATKFVKKARKFYSKMKAPSTKYNAYSKFRPSDTPIKTWTDDDRFILMINSDVASEVDVEVLARAFNIDYTKFLGRVIEVDEFKNPNILGVLCDEAWFQIYDNLMRFDEFYNASVMAWNEYLHVWQTFAICPFANAILFATEMPVPATEIKLSAESYNLPTGTDSINGTLTITPVNSTTDIEFQSSDDLVFKVIKTSNTGFTIERVGVGSATLYAFSDNGLETSADVTVG